MRLGTNPEKLNKDLKFQAYHRIVIPVYIPHFNDYFKDSLNIFKLCIESLLLTVHSKTRITIYNNNSHVDVKSFIDQCYKDNEFVDQVFHSKYNVGKINAILSSVKGNLEPLITISDADVLFKNGWQEAIEDLFFGFPEAGMICPVPSSKGIRNYVNNNWYYGLFKGSLNFKKVRDPQAMLRFDKSLGNEKTLLKPSHLEKYLVLKNKLKTHEAVMGGGHFVATLKREIFDKGSNQPAFIKIVGGIEEKYIDYPNQKLGYLRIATLENYAFHMGNSTESWMYEEFKLLTKNNKDPRFKLSKLENKPISVIGRKIGFLFQKLINKYSFIKHYFFTKFGFKNFDY